MRGNFFFGGRAFPPRRPTRRGEVFPPARRGSAPAEKSQKSARTTRAEQQEQDNKSRTTPRPRGGRAPCARPLPLPPPPPRGLPHLTPNNGGAGRARCARPLPPFPLPAGLGAPDARAHSRSRHRPRGGSPTFPPKHIVQGERETIAPAFFISAARRRAAAPRGAPKSHFKSRHHFFISAEINIATMRMGTRAGPPHAVLPLPRCPPRGRARAGRGGGLPLPLGRGRPLSRRRARKTALGSSSHSVAWFARVPRFAPAASGER